MEHFKYVSNHPCHLSLKVNNEYKDFSLFKGEVYELPEENSVVQRMLSQGLIESSTAAESISTTDTTLNTQTKNKKSNGS